MEKISSLIISYKRFLNKTDFSKYFLFHSAFESSVGLTVLSNDVLKFYFDFYGRAFQNQERSMVNYLTNLRENLSSAAINQEIEYQRALISDSMFLFSSKYVLAGTDNQQRDKLEATLLFLNQLSHSQRSKYTNDKNESALLTNILRDFRYKSLKNMQARGEKRDSLINYKSLMSFLRDIWTLFPDVEPVLIESVKDVVLSFLKIQPKADNLGSDFKNALPEFVFYFVSVMPDQYEAYNFLLENIKKLNLTKLSDDKIRMLKFSINYLEYVTEANIDFSEFAQLKDVEYAKRGLDIGDDYVALIEAYLKDRNIIYIKEYVFGSTLLPVDFYLPSYNLVLQFDGFQHYLGLIEVLRLKDKRADELLVKREKVDVERIKTRKTKTYDRLGMKIIFEQIENAIQARKLIVLNSDIISEMLPNLDYDQCARAIRTSDTDAIDE